MNALQSDDNPKEVNTDDGWVVVLYFLPAILEFELSFGSKDMWMTTKVEMNYSNSLACYLCGIKLIAPVYTRHAENNAQISHLLPEIKQFAIVLNYLTSQI